MSVATPRRGQNWGRHGSLLGKIAKPPFSRHSLRYRGMSLYLVEPPFASEQLSPLETTDAQQDCLRCGSHSLATTLMPYRRDLWTHWDHVAKRNHVTLASIISTKHNIQTAMGLFGPAFNAAGQHFAHFVDYFTWVEDATDYSSSKGHCYFFTFGELLSLWSDPSKYLNYESMMVRLHRSGLDIRRAFAVDPATLRIAETERALFCAVERQDRLGLAPRVIPVNDVRSSMSDIGIACDAAAVLHGSISLYLQDAAVSDPAMLRCWSRSIVTKTENKLHSIWQRRALTASQWRQQLRVPPAKAWLDSIDNDLYAIEAFVSSYR